MKPLIDAMLSEDLTAPRKQRHTARRVLARLVDEHGHADMKYPTVRDYVARRRAAIASEAGTSAAEAMVPQSHEPGGEAEVDFAELWVDLGSDAVRTEVFLFTLRLSHSGRAVHRVFATQAQEAFLGLSATPGADVKHPLRVGRRQLLGSGIGVRNHDVRGDHDVRVLSAARRLESLPVGYDGLECRGRHIVVVHR